MMPPPAPGIVVEATFAGRWLFRWRSYLPLVVLAYVLVVAAVRPIPPGGRAAIPWWSAAGIFLGLLGYLFRAWTVGHVPMGTSGRGTADPIAASLNTRGTYSVVRHPLYFGNFLLWMGTTVVAGSLSALLVVALAFWVYYERIMIAEERFLYERFGNDFREWARQTPAFWPDFHQWVPSPHVFSPRFALGRDYQALYSLVAATTAIQVARNVSLGRNLLPALAWRWYFAAGTAFYLMVDVLKRRRLLERMDA
jgi:protein-S-isoprenylcysteine O-methyltransferase Ste14